MVVTCSCLFELPSTPRKWRLFVVYMKMKIHSCSYGFICVLTISNVSWVQGEGGTLLSWLSRPWYHLRLPTLSAWVSIACANYLSALCVYYFGYLVRIVFHINKLHECCNFVEYSINNCTCAISHFSPPTWPGIEANEARKFSDKVCYSHTCMPLQYHIGCFNHRVVTQVAD